MGKQLSELVYKEVKFSTSKITNFIKKIFPRRKGLLAFRIEVGTLQGDQVKTFIQEQMDEIGVKELEKDLNCKIVFLPMRQGYGGVIEKII